MIHVDDAVSIVNDTISSWKTGTSEVFADRDYPPFDRVMMDGIAVRFHDYEKGQREFKIFGTAAAGEMQKTLSEGCLEVMTGAPLPSGADLVIQYEHLEIKDGMARVTKELSRGRLDSVHLKGSDCKEGDSVLDEGLFLNGPHIGIMASMGHKSITSSPKVMIISTGDELVEDNPLPHQIRRSNAYALKTSLEINGYSEVVLDHLADDAKAVHEHYIEHAQDFDMMIYSGGVSKGKFDYLPNVWADLGITKLFHGVAQRPGKPLWFGSDQKTNTVIVGLPGNPVSSLVCLHRYIIPGRVMSVKLSEEVIFKKPLTYFVPVKIDFNNGEVLATPLKIKNSGEFTALAGSDGFIELPQDGEYFKSGDIFKFFSWRNF